MHLYIVPTLSFALLLAVSNCSSPYKPVLGTIQAKDRWMADNSVRMIHGGNPLNKQPTYDLASLGFDETHGAFRQDHGFPVSNPDYPC